MFAGQGDVATFEQIVALVGRWGLHRLLRDGTVVKLWPGVYCRGVPSTRTRLNGLDLRCGEPVAACLHTAAHAFGFGTETTTKLHVLNPVGHQLRPDEQLVVHRRDGAPLTAYRGRPLTAPAWTAVEVARTLRRPRALATLDAALRSGHCDPGRLVGAGKAQAGRRGIVAVRELIPLARAGAESPMESEARLVMIDGGLPEPLLQYEIIDLDGRRWRFDFAWPGAKLLVEYEGFDWHSSPEALQHDRQKRAAVDELGWRLLCIVCDDVRRRPAQMVRRIRSYL